MMALRAALRTWFTYVPSICILDWKMKISIHLYIVTFSLFHFFDIIGAGFSAVMANSGEHGGFEGKGIP
jgi:hypothetical protein